MDFSKTNRMLRHRCYTEKSYGKITYDPKRNGRLDPWSAIIEVDQDLADYYYYLFLTHYHVPIVRPSWKAHISLIKGVSEYNPLFDNHWNYKNGQEVDFVYNTDIYWNHEFIWLNTYCEQYFHIREKMGLAHVNNEGWGHITIAKFRTPGSLGKFTDYHDPLPPKHNLF
jgi:hypothetical protein